MPLAHALEETTWQTIRDWLIAAGSFGALLVALYVGVIAGVLRRPSLTLSFNPVEGLGDALVVGEDLFVGAQHIGRADSAYLRPRVGNKPRRRTAEDVEVLILAMDRVDTKVPSPNLGDFPLTWSNSHPTTTTRNIPSGVERHIDLLSVIEHNPSGGPARQLIMAVHPEPSDSRHHLPPGRYLIALDVTARNADAQRYTVLVSYDGGWSPDVWDHLKVEEIKPLRP
jgi:hypothetical protein